MKITHVLEVLVLGSGLAVALAATPSFAADSGADDLLDTVQGTHRVQIDDGGAADKKSALSRGPRIREARVVGANVNEPFERQLFAKIEMTENLSYDLREWTNHIFSGEYHQAAHLWTAIQEQIPESFRQAADAAYLYTLWHLNVPQTFFYELTKNLAKPSYVNSNYEIALEASIGKDFDKFLTDNAVQINPSQAAMIERLDNKQHVIALPLKARLLFRKGEQAEAMLKILPPQNRLRIELAQTAALAHARKHDLVGAAKILKQEEDTIDSLHDPILLSQHYLTVARLLFQAGQLKGAVAYYDKIPNKVPQYLPAQEELAWVLLRLGESSRLRGQLKTLSSPVFRDRFEPEVYLVRAISNLKMCLYDQVQKDFGDFTDINGGWAKKIDQALAMQNPPAPPNNDAFSSWSTKSVTQLTAEKRRLETLGHESIAATLPAVGVQKHWKEAENELDAALNLAKQNESNEFRRQWTNDRSILTESVRKMRFVKVEFMTQVRNFSSQAQAQIDSKALVADNSLVPKVKIEKQPDQIAFPVDNVMWPDEMFKMRSLAQSRCLSKSGGSH